MKFLIIDGMRYAARHIVKWHRYDASRTSMSLSTNMGDLVLCDPEAIDRAMAILANEGQIFVHIKGGKIQ